MQIPQNLAPYMRDNLNPALLTEKNGILQYLNPQYLAGDNEKYQKLYDRLAPLYDFGEGAGFVGREIDAAHMKHDVKAVVSKGQIFGGAMHQRQFQFAAPDFLRAAQHAERDVRANELQAFRVHIRRDVVEIFAGTDGDVKRFCAVLPFE